MKNNPVVQGLHKSLPDELDIEIGALQNSEDQPLLVQVNESFQKTADKTNRHFSAMGTVLAATTVLAALMTKKDLMSKDVMENTHVIMGAVALAGTLVMTGLAVGSRQEKRKLLEALKDEKEIFTAFRDVGKILAKTPQEQAAIEGKFQSLSGHLLEKINAKMQENKPLECAGRLISCVKTNSASGDVNPINPDNLSQMMLAAEKAAETKHDRYLVASVLATVVLGASLIAVACGKDSDLALSFVALGGLAPLAAGIASKRGQYNENALTELRSTMSGINLSEFVNLQSAVAATQASADVSQELNGKLSQLSEHFTSYQKFREGVLKPKEASSLKAILGVEKEDLEATR